MLHDWVNNTYTWCNNIIMTNQRVTYSEVTQKAIKIIWIASEFKTDFILIDSEVLR